MKFFTIEKDQKEITDFFQIDANSTKINENFKNNQNHHIDFFVVPYHNIYGFTSIFFDSPKSNFTQKVKKDSTNDLKLVTTPSTNSINKNYGKILEQENHSSPAKEIEISSTTTISVEEIEETKTTAPI